MVVKERKTKKRHEYIGIPVSPEEKRVIEKEAEYQGLTTAAYCRWKLIGIARKNEITEN